MGRMLPARRTVLAALGASVAVGLTGCGLGAVPRAIRSAPPVLPPGPLEMTVFAPDYTAPSRLDQSADGIDLVSVASIALVDGGAALTPTSARVLAMKKRADELGKPATILLTNSAPGVGFSRSLADGMLSSAANRAAVATALREKVRAEGWNGIMLDLESLSGDQAADYVRFAAALRKEVGGDVRLDASIMSATSRRGFLDRGYDVERLARHLDHLTLMAYDQHGTWDPSNPGPIGALPWQRACLDALLELVPAGQIDLGVAGYGYRWLGPDGPHALSTRQARELVATTPGASVRWDDEAKEWTATLPDGQVAWWSDATSLRYRVDLAEQKRINGVAVWSLAVADPLPPRG